MYTALFNDTYCQRCQRFITEEQWDNRQLKASGQLVRKVSGYWPAHFSQRKWTRDEGSVFEKEFQDMIFGNENELAVYGFSKTYFMMVSKLNDYAKHDDDDDKDDSGFYFRDSMIAQIKQGFNNKSFSLQGQDKLVDSLQN